MKSFEIPLIPARLERNTDSKMESHKIPCVELEYCWPEHMHRTLFTAVFIAGGIDGIGLSFCSEAPHAHKSRMSKADTGELLKYQGSMHAAGITAQKRPYKGLVYEDDCLEVFLRPQNADFYYCWEINAAGSCLDYRTACSEQGIALLSAEMEKRRENPSSVTRSGLYSEEVAGKKLLFDYDWKSRAKWSWQTDEEFWYLELYIPWSDFGLDSAPAAGTKWTGTCNRIDVSAKKKTGNIGLLSLLEGTPVIRFHQPEHFAEFTFLPQQDLPPE